MAALKKAYADVLLNTAKESATRILASESKAAILQRDLAATKKEALGMLLRMKSIMDAKMNEADIISLEQNTRICELENQLNEAELTIAFLKEEFKKVNDEREKMKSTLSEEPCMKKEDRDTFTGDVCEDKPILLQCCIGSGDCDALRTSDMNFNDKSETFGGNCCDSYENSSKNESLQKSYPETNCSGSPDLASFVMRRDEPELYRNGCTQRIRALGQNVVTENSQINRQIPKTTSVVCKNEKLLNPCSAGSCVSNYVLDCLTEPNAIEKKNENYKTNSTGNFLYKYSVKKPRSRSTRVTNVITFNKDTADHEISPGPSKDELHEADLSTTDSYLCSETMNEIDKDSAYPANSAFNYVIPAPESSIQNTKSQHMICNGEQSVSSSGLKSTEISDISNCNMGLEMTGVHSQDSDRKDAKVCESNGTPTKVTSERPLKYTFQRKRMKGTSTNGTEDNQLDKKNTLNRKLSETRDIAGEPQKPNHIMVSSRESRRIAQVAHQLISLSEKRW